MSCVRIYRAQIAPSARGGRRAAECDAVGRLVERVFGTGTVIGHCANGRPYIPDMPDMHISIAHCIDECVLAVSDEPVGIDIETARRQLERVAPRFLTSAELSAGPYDLVALMHYWSAKEAVFKCADVSELVISGIEVTIDVDSGSGLARIVDMDGKFNADEEIFSVYFPLVSADRVIAIAVKEVNKGSIDIQFL